MNVQRYEFKYLINHIEYHSLVNRLKYVLKTDPHNIPHQGYFIRSLYFDSIEDECYFDKLAGINQRKKYRLRIYDFDTKQVKFEIKNKQGNRIFKETAIITRETAEKVVRGKYEGLLEYNDPILRKVYAAFKKDGYTPRVIVDYYRDAYVYDFFNTRITFDRKLKSNHLNLDLFSRDLPTIPVIFEEKEILEIKFNDHLPDFIKGLLRLDSFERTAVSKYALSRRHFMLTC